MNAISEESKKQKSTIQVVVRVALIAIILVVAILFTLTRFEHPYRPYVLNLLGMNPTVRWVGKKAPSITLPELYTGKRISLSSYEGKVVLLDFWASWCPDCLKSLPMIQRFHHDPTLKDKVRIVSVNIREHGKNVRQRIASFMRSGGFDFPVLLGDMDTVKKYNIWFIPAIVILTAKGKVFYAGAEYHDEKRLRNLLLQAAK